MLPDWCSESAIERRSNLVLPILALTGKGKFINRPTITGGKKYDKYFLYIPSDVANDSQFPFKAGDVIHIKVDPRRGRISVVKQATDE